MNQETNYNRNEKFEEAMRLIGHREFRMENGRYCLQSLNELQQAFEAGVKIGRQQDTTA